MGFNFESAGPAVADIDNASVLARALQHAAATRGQAFQMHARRLVGAVLTPHHAENAEFGDCRFATAEQSFDFFEFVEGKAVLPDQLGSYAQGRRSGHGETLFSHLRVRVDSGKSAASAVLYHFFL